MNNRITASVEFYFKGKKLSPAVELDVDQYMQTTGKLPALYPLLARSINIDPYSYEHEMMEAETIVFSNAHGLIAQYVADGTLDFEAFKIAWKEAQALEKLQKIAQQHLSIDDIMQQPDLKNALLQAYQLGVESKTKE